MKKISIPQLEKEVRKHNRLYFVAHKPVISDEEFDRLVESLRKLKPDSPALEEIGSDVPVAAKTMPHQTPMLSLDKCYNEEDLLRWADKFDDDVVAMPKIDGCAVALLYGSDGAMSVALTRGSGTEGEVITPNVKFISSIPQKTGLKNVEVRGEVYMPLSVFKKFSETFANPRNLAAGAIKQKDPEKTGGYRLSFFAYDLLHAGCKTEVEKRRLLEKNKFKVAEGELVPKAKMQEAYETFFKDRLLKDYETDGVVFRVNKISEQDELGVTAHHPRFAIAYKFQGDSGETTLKDVLWSVSRTGTITPVGLVDPVILSGATVTRVSLHNFGLAKKLLITIPCKVLMVRRGGVIPNIEKVIHGGGKSLHAPRKCPSCGAPVELKDDFLYCTNPQKCSVSKVGELNHFVKVVGIDGFGRKHLEQLYEEGLVQEPADFYKLKTEDLIALERMGEKLAAKLIANIESRKKLPLEVFLRSFGISELGKHVSKILAEKYHTLDALFKVSIEELSEIHTLAEKIATMVVEGLKEKKPQIERLLKFVTLEKPSARKMTGPMAGKSFLFTGSMVSMERSKATELVESKGGTAASGVSSQLDFLVVGDGGGAGSKLKKVEKLQQSGVTIRILSEKEFLKLMGS
ncbi:MAG: NAD-dependent DNA ligase LigA [Deltaproteobacteria bacterium]|nr:NAD-dependent DNA ligase LigA [Deltaproteobacteria bacterium]